MKRHILTTLASVLLGTTLSCVMNRTNFSIVSQSATTEGKIGTVQPSDQSMQADKTSELDTAVSTSAGSAQTGGKVKQADDGKTEGKEEEQK